MKQHSTEELNQSERTENIVALSVFAVMLLVAVAFLTNGFGYFNKQDDLGSNIVVPFDNDPVRGNGSQADVAIYIFSDFQCPFCKKGEDTVQRIFDKYNGRVSLVFKNYPLVQIHPDAFNAAMAAECANEQGKFWEYHDFLFSHQTALTGIDLKAYAKEIGLDTDRFNYCLESQKYAPSVQKDMRQAQEIGITSTPTFIIDGKAIVGSQPDETFDSAITSALSRAGRR